MATTPVKTDPATEAWTLVLAMFFGERPPRLSRIAAEFDVSPMAIKMLQWLEPGAEMTMSGLAEHDLLRRVQRDGDRGPPGGTRS